MGKYQIFFAKQAAKDIKLLSPKQKKKLRTLLSDIISEDPFLGKKLLGDLDGNFSYRLDIKNRIIYSVNKEKKEIFIKRTRTHYGE